MCTDTDRQQDVDQQGSHRRGSYEQSKGINGFLKFWISLMLKINICKCLGVYSRIKNIDTYTYIHIILQNRSNLTFFFFFKQGYGFAK